MGPPSVRPCDGLLHPTDVRRLPALQSWQPCTRLPARSPVLGPGGRQQEPATGSARQHTQGLTATDSARQHTHTTPCGRGCSVAKCCQTSCVRVLKCGCMHAQGSWRDGEHRLPAQLHGLLQVRGQEMACINPCQCTCACVVLNTSACEGESATETSSCAHLCLPASFVVRLPLAYVCMHACIMYNVRIHTYIHTYILNIFV